MSKEIFYVEVTDTFGGEANYSWVYRFKVHAKSFRGAIVKVGREMGLPFRVACHFPEFSRYDSKSGATCAFVSDYIDQAEYMNVKSI